MSELEAFLPPLDKRRETLREICEPAIDGEGCELVFLALVGATKAPTLRLYVDKKGDETIEIKSLEKVNRLLGDLLDVEDAHQGLFRAGYSLEVSSPGVDRPLAKRSHYESAVGQEIKCKTKVAIANARAHKGTLQSVGDDSIVINVDSNDVEVPFSSIDSAHIVFVFPGQSTKPKQNKRTKKKSAKKKSKKSA